MGVGRSCRLPSAAWVAPLGTPFPLGPPLCRLALLPWPPAPMDCEEVTGPNLFRAAVVARRVLGGTPANVKLEGLSRPRPNLGKPHRFDWC